MDKVIKREGKNFTHDIELDSGKSFVVPMIEKAKFEQDDIGGSKNIVQNEMVIHPLQIQKEVFKPRDTPLSVNYESDKPYLSWKVNIASWSDVDKRTFACWGDHWVKVRLAEELEKLGCVTDVELDQADVTIYLFGSPFNFRKKRPYHYNPLSYNVVWFYSHPEKFSQQEAARYDHIFCLSKQYLETIKEGFHHTVEDEPLYSCTNFTTPVNLPYGRDKRIAMVANARGAGAPYGREVIKLLKPLKSWMESKELRMEVWGHKWDQFDKYNQFPKEWYVDKYYPYDDLDRLYRTSKAVIIDGHPEMEEHGFVPMKIFDVFASGGMPIIKRNAGTTEMFGDYVLQYDSVATLKECLEVLDDRAECFKIIKKGRTLAYKHTYANRAKKIMDSIADSVIGTDQLKIPESGNKAKDKIVWL